MLVVHLQLGVISGGGGSPFTNTIEYIEIPTTGNAVDFGDLTQRQAPGSGLSLTVTEGYKSWQN